MMREVSSAFDPARYLRMVGEASVASPSPPPDRPVQDSPVTEVAAALVAVGAVAADVAIEVVRDYLPVDSQGRSQSDYFQPMPPRQHVTAPRVVVCDQTIEQRWGRLHVNYVALGDHSTSVAAAASAATGKPMTAGHHMMLSDDTGGVEIAHFTGKYSDGTWTGRLSTEHPLSRGTGWINIDGARLDLPDNGNRLPAVEVERLAEADVGERYLWLRLAVSGQGPVYYRPPASLQAVATALVAAGALKPESPAIEKVLAVAHALQQGVGAAYGHLPQPWASLIARLGTSDDRRRSVPVGVVTLPVDGVVISVEGVVLSDPSSGEQSGPARGFEVYVTTSPGVGFGPHLAIIDRPRIGWWAHDDRNNYYLGSQGTWGFSHDGGQSHGTVNYQPALDPRATELRLMPTGLTQQAIITLPVLPAR
jgi:hypothetical protein